MYPPSSLTIYVSNTPDGFKKMYFIACIGNSLKQYWLLKYQFWKVSWDGESFDWVYKVSSESNFQTIDGRDQFSGQVGQFLISLNWHLLYFTESCMSFDIVIVNTVILVYIVLYCFLISNLYIEILHDLYWMCNAAYLITLKYHLIHK